MDAEEREALIAGAVEACDQLVSAVEQRKEALRRGDLWEAWRLAGLVALWAGKHDVVAKQMWVELGDSNSEEERG